MRVESYTYDWCLLCSLEGLVYHTHNFGLAFHRIQGKARIGQDRIYPSGDLQLTRKINDAFVRRTHETREHAVQVLTVHSVLE